MKDFILAITILLFLAACQTCSCKKDKEEDPKPAATQEGLSTFFCKINGVPYAQRKVKGSDAPFYSVYPQISSVLDPDPAFGEFTIDITYPNYEDSEYITINGSKIFSSGIYSIESKSTMSAYYWKKNGCNFLESSIEKDGGVIGKLNLSKYDRTKRIIAGTFEFKIWKNKPSDCDTVRITEGIFDLLY